MPLQAALPLARSHAVNNLAVFVPGYDAFHLNEQAVIVGMIAFPATLGVPHPDAVFRATPDKF